MSRKPPRPYADKLSSFIRRRAHVLEVLRELVRLRKARFAELLAAVRGRNPGLSLANSQFVRVLKETQRLGLVFKEPVSKVYHPTTLALGIVWDEESVDWLPVACLAHSIIAESGPDVDVVAKLGDELQLDEVRAEAVRAALVSVPRRVSLPRLGRCLQGGGAAVAFVPTEYPHPLPGNRFDTRRHAGDDARCDGAELIYAPRMDTVAERLLLNALRHAGYDDDMPGAVDTLPMGRRFLDACDGAMGEPRVFRPKCSVVSMSSPKVNPFTLDLMLRYESPLSFLNDFSELKLELDPDCAMIPPFTPQSEIDFAVLMRFMDPESGASHFIVFGLYPPGTLAAAQYFRSNIDMLLRDFSDSPFLVLLQTKRPTTREWDEDNVIQYDELYKGRFRMVDSLFDIDIRCQPGMEVLLWLLDRHPKYFVELIGENEVTAIEKQSWHQFRKANRLLGLLQQKGLLVQAIIDAVLVESFKLKSSQRTEFIDAVQEKGLGTAVAKDSRFRQAFFHTVLDYTWELIDDISNYVQKRMELYAFHQGGGEETFVRALSSEVPMVTQASTSTTPVA